MILIAVTEWRHKAGIVIRLLLFLLLLWLITPQFLNYVSGHVTSFKDRLHAQPPGVRVEQQVQNTPVPAPDQGAFLKLLQEYYSGNIKQALPNSQ